jgi:hypothetical protein
MGTEPRCALNTMPIQRRNGLVVLSYDNKSVDSGSVPVMGSNPSAHHDMSCYIVILSSANSLLASVANSGKGGSAQGKSDRAE